MQYIDQLSQLIDIRVVTNDLNQVTVFTNSGVQLVGTEAAKLSFNPQGTVTPNTLFNPDPTKSNVGTITINFPHGGSYDLVSTNSIRSGKLAAYLELRDKTLVQAQAQIDQFAASMSSALSDQTTAGVAAPASALPQAGFDLDLSGLQTGNVVHVSYKDNTTGITHNLSIVRVDDPSVLPLSNTATRRSERRRGRHRFLGRHGFGRHPAQRGARRERQPAVLQSVRARRCGCLTTARRTGRTSPRRRSPRPCRRSPAAARSFRCSPTAARSTPARSPPTARSRPVSRAASASTTRWSAIPPAPSSFRPVAAHRRGRYHALRFHFHPADDRQLRYSPQTGIGTTGSPFTGTLLNFARQVISQQGEAASSAKQLADGQDVVLNTLQNKMNATSGVNIDDEMAHLLALQNAYSANARVMSSRSSRCTTC